MIKTSASNQKYQLLSIQEIELDDEDDEDVVTEFLKKMKIL